MSDEQKQPDPHQADKEHVAAQVGAINMISRASELVSGLPFGGNIRVFGKTDFEGHALNDMIDMVDSANPEHLESAGTALLNARDAIQTAAEELQGHVGNVEWQGESGTAFREWGDKLVKHALALSTFAEVAGTQITAAATGLASVRNSMPPRDNRIAPKTVDEIPTPQQVDGNKEYAAAVKAEKDRQEAINQMNRLASFYAVSEETLAAQEAPTFEAMPDVGVPKPLNQKEGWDPGGSAGQSLGSTSGDTGGSSHGSVNSQVERPRAHDTLTPPHSQVDPVTQPDREIGTKIDSVGTLPQQEPKKLAPHVPTTTGSGGTVPPSVTGGAPPVFGQATGRTSGFGGATGNRAPVSAQGRAGTPGGTAGARGATGPMGRAAATGQAGARGGGAAAGRQPMGRGVTGGTPRPMGGTTNGRAGGIGPTGAARGNGVVGGRPTNGTSSGTTGARVPRGTVVGAEGNTGARASAGGIGQRGVIGAPNANPRPGRTGRLTAGNSDGVVGTPTGRAPAGRNGGFTGGSAEAPHGPTGNRRSTNREGREDERRQDTQRRDVPPATD
ncbi:WXG100 family type VII secretion target [Streptomyces sp. NPDC096132]|uniref:WXG100 family type VII secretion target n=1 Tax=Streptomyces sp. NPDC096132 TaxID=3366075 RepID=UPI003804EC69